MIHQCSVCKKVLRVTRELPLDAISDGLCPTCEEQTRRSWFERKNAETDSLPLEGGPELFGTEAVRSHVALEERRRRHAGERTT